jgi:hypothetical protein
MSTPHASFRLKQVETVGRDVLSHTAMAHRKAPNQNYSVGMDVLDISLSLLPLLTELCRAPNNARSDYSQDLQRLLLAIVTDNT